jgi:3-methyladenine DNA glycosylase AlkD
MQIGTVNMPTLEEVLAQLESLADADHLAGMEHFAIKTEHALGISIYELRKVADQIGVDHALAQQLWNTGILEARILASYIDDPAQVSEAQLESWVAGFDSWAVCDQVCDLFERTPYAYHKVFEWSQREEEFVKRTAFALIAGLAVHDKAATDEQFESFFPLIIREASDERNFVKKAVNWALRNIGKRNRHLNVRAIEVARQVEQLDSKSARWIARDALRELTSEKIQKRLGG